MGDELIYCAGCKYADCKSVCMSFLAMAKSVLRDYKTDIIACSSGMYDDEWRYK